MSESNTVPFSQSAFTWIKHAIADALSIPLRVENYLKDHPEMRVDQPQLGHVICRDVSLVRWEMWSDVYKEDIHFWKRDIDMYRCESISSPDLNNLVIKEEVENWSCDISEVEGVTASKANLKEFATLDDMIKNTRPKQIDPITNEKLEENLAHHGIRIIHRKSDDCFVRYKWDGRLYVSNTDGSHALAAARYLAMRLPRKVPLTGKLCIYRLNPLSVNSINTTYRMFIVHTDHFFGGFSDALEAFDCPYGLRSAPQLFGNSQILFLSKNNARAMRVADLLEKEGYFNFNNFLVSQLVGDGAQRRKGA